MSEIKISQAVRDFADLAAKAVKVLPDGTSEIDGNFYLNQLAAATGIDAEKLAEIPKFDSVFVPGTALAIGEQANEAFKADKNLDRVTIDVPGLGQNSFTFDMRRSVQGINPKTKEQITTYGVMSASHTTRAVHNAGDYARVRELLKDSARAAFGD